MFNGQSNQSVLIELCKRVEPIISCLYYTGRVVIVVVWPARSRADSNDQPPAGR